MQKPSFILAILAAAGGLACAQSAFAREAGEGPRHEDRHADHQADRQADRQGSSHAEPGDDRGHHGEPGDDRGSR